MAAEILAQRTPQGRAFWANLFTGAVGFTVPDNAPPTAGWNPKITHFRIGEGGWIDLGAGPQPRPLPTGDIVYESGPNVGINDLDAAVDAFRLGPVRYPLDSRFVFEKAFIGADITYDTPTTPRFRCRLELAEANNDGFGNSPEFWEIGLYAEYPLDTTKRMCVAYATMPKVTKNGATVIEEIIRLRF